jgi:hypothetical protein
MKRAATLGLDQRAPEGPIHRPDEAPRSHVGHSELFGRVPQLGRSADRFEKIRLAGTDDDVLVAKDPNPRPDPIEGARLFDVGHHVEFSGSRVEAVEADSGSRHRSFVCLVPAVGQSPAALPAAPASPLEDPGAWRDRDHSAIAQQESEAEEDHRERQRRPRDEPFRQAREHEHGGGEREKGEKTGHGEILRFGSRRRQFVAELVGAK